MWKRHGIVHQYCIPRTLEENGLVEREIITLDEIINAMLLSVKFSPHLWGEASLSACHTFIWFLLKYLIFLHSNSGKEENPTLVTLKCGCILPIVTIRILKGLSWVLEKLNVLL